MQGGKGPLGSHQPTTSVVVIENKLVLNTTQLIPHLVYKCTYDTIPFPCRQISLLGMTVSF